MVRPAFSKVEQQEQGSRDSEGKERDPDQAFRPEVQMESTRTWGKFWAATGGLHPASGAVSVLALKGPPRNQDFLPDRPPADGQVEHGR
jgi:hypothetical protein